jgi:type IV pilus assembly protein PilX
MRPATRIAERHHPERGMVLITSLLLLIIVTLLALAMFRGTGLEGRIAGNTMDKQRALQAATTAEDYAEQWLVANVATATAVTCTASTFSGTIAPTICSNTLATSTAALSATTVPWDIGGSAGYTYNPVVGSSTLFPVTTTTGTDQYYEGNGYLGPVVYVADLGADAATSNAEDYQVDAWSYAGAQSTVAVVESTYQIRYISEAPGP